MRRDHQSNQFSKDEPRSPRPKKQPGTELSQVDGAPLKNKKEGPKSGKAAAKPRPKKRGASRTRRRPIITLRTTPPGKSDKWWWIWRVSVGNCSGAGSVFNLRLDFGSPAWTGKPGRVTRKRQSRLHAVGGAGFSAQRQSGTSHRSISRF